MKILGLVCIIAMVCVVGCGENPILPDSVDVAKIAGCATDVEKIDGNYIVRADAACIDDLLGSPIEADNTQPEAVSIDGCEGPFGLDSGDETTYVRNNIRYNLYLGIVTSVNLERNEDGSWYVHECEVWIGYGNEYNRSHTVIFSSPQPARFEINEGDYIGFLSGTPIWRWSALREGLIGWRHCSLYENISTQSISCEVNTPNNLLKPGEVSFSTDYEFLKITGIIANIRLIRNRDPEPDNSHDFLIDKAVIKCADGNLYIVDFRTSHYAGLNRETVETHLPGQDAFSEGDVITVTQTGSLTDKGWFSAFFEE